MTPLQIKGLVEFWDKYFFRASFGQTVVRKKEMLQKPPFSRHTCSIKANTTAISAAYKYMDR